jgi:hypothetical protein
MKAISAALACLTLAVALLVSSPARAGEVNCAKLGACGFGTLVGSKAGTVLISKGDRVAFIERVYRNSRTGLFTYVFTVDNAGRAELASINTLTVAGGDHFDMGDKYGVITGLTSSAYGSVAFDFNPLNLTVCFESSSVGCTDSLAKGGYFTFYVQSANGPQAGQFSVTGSDPAPSLDPTPEPRTLVFLGLALVFLTAGVPFAIRHWRTHET